MSDIWKHYNKNLTGATCKICAKKVTRSDGSTTGMWKHLEAKHQKEFSVLKNTENLGQMGEDKKQKQIQSFLVTKKNETEIAEERIVRIMVRQNNSFYFFDDPDLKDLFQKAHPNIDLGAREHFRRKVIPRMSDQIRCLIQSGVGSDHETTLSDLESLSDFNGEQSDESIKYDIWKPKSPGCVSVPSTISGTSHSTQTTRIQLQLAAYKAFDRPSVNADLFTWWREIGNQFPDLIILARIVHSIHATSVSSERLFSKAGLIYSNKLRNRLGAEMAENLLLIKANMDRVFLAPSTEPDEEEQEMLDSDNLEVIEEEK